jgi:hypothetical protein
MNDLCLDTLNWMINLSIKINCKIKNYFLTKDKIFFTWVQSNMSKNNYTTLEIYFDSYKSGTKYI